MERPNSCKAFAHRSIRAARPAQTHGRGPAGLVVGCSGGARAAPHELFAQRRHICRRARQKSARTASSWRGRSMRHCGSRRLVWGIGVAISAARAAAADRSSACTAPHTAAAASSYTAAPTTITAAAVRTGAAGPAAADLHWRRLMLRRSRQSLRRWWAWCRV